MQRKSINFGQQSLRGGLAQGASEVPLDFGLCFDPAAIVIMQIGICERLAANGGGVRHNGKGGTRNGLHGCVAQVARFFRGAILAVMHQIVVWPVRNPGS